VLISPPAHIGFDLATQHRQGLAKGQVGIAGAGVGVARAADDQQLRIRGLGLAGKLLHQHRLAAPGLADDKQNLTRPTAGGR